MSFESTLEFSRDNSYERQVERIQGIFDKILIDRVPEDKLKKMTREITADIYDLALDIDENIYGLLKDPKVLENYTYNGKFFEKKDGRGFLKAFDGINLLMSLDEINLGSFFEQFSDIDKARKEILEWLSDYLKTAKARFLNWKEEGSLLMISKDILERIIREHKISEAERSTMPLTSSEKNFFALYESEMDKFQDKKGEEEK